MVALSQVGGAVGVVPLVAALVLLLMRRWRADALFVALAYGGAVALDGMVKGGLPRGYQPAGPRRVSLT